MKKYLPSVSKSCSVYIKKQNWAKSSIWGHNSKIGVWGCASHKNHITMIIFTYKSDGNRVRGFANSVPREKSEKVCDICWYRLFILHYRLWLIWLERRHRACVVRSVTRVSPIPPNTLYVSVTSITSYWMISLPNYIYTVKTALYGANSWNPIVNIMIHYHSVINSSIGNCPHRSIVIWIQAK